LLTERTHKIKCTYSVTLCGVTEESSDEKDLILEPGEHCLPFSCRLLPDLPASFEGDHGCIRYVAKTIIEQTPSSSPPSSPLSSSAAAAAAKSDVIVARRPFTMAPGLNLCFLPEATVSQLQL